MTERTELAQAIRTLREDYREETQVRFAESMGVSQVTIARYETGSYPSRAALKKLLGMSEQFGYTDGVTVFSENLRSGNPTKGHRTTPDEETNRAAGHNQALIETVYGIASMWRLLRLRNHLDGTEDAEAIANEIDAEFAKLKQLIHPD